MQDPKKHPTKPLKLPEESATDGFPADDDISTPPEGSDQADHPDKKDDGD